MSYCVPKKLITEYSALFNKYNIPRAGRKKSRNRAERIVMVSTHGYWGDPPPAGVPDTGGQTYYVLEVSKAWARMGKKVIILARWFKPYPRVEKFGKNVWLIRIRAGGNNFIRKEDIYSLVPEMAEAATAISHIFGADAVLGHYADGMAAALEVAERLKLPLINIPHSMGIRKLMNLQFDPNDPESWIDLSYNFWIRESLEITSLLGANIEIANTPAEPNILKSYYKKEFPHVVMPAGAGMEYFNIFSKKPCSKYIEGFGLESKKYIVFFGRLSKAKNISGGVALLAEAKKLAPRIFKNIKFVIIGGNPYNPEKEEVFVEDAIRSKAKKYKIPQSSIVRISSKNWNELAEFAYHSLAYVGMQMMEPFGMGAAEAMAAGTPIVISKKAGITRWLKDGVHALIVDPTKPKEAAAKLISSIRNKRLPKIGTKGRDLAKKYFSWDGNAKQIGALIDDLINGRRPDIMNYDPSFESKLKKRSERAYQRAAFIWRGDPPRIKEKHKKAAKELLSIIKLRAQDAKKNGKRLTVGLAGESGSGKTEIAEYLRFLLRKEDLRSQTIPGDAFFKLVPSLNHMARKLAHNKKKLKHYLGPQEVDLDRLDIILNIAHKRKMKVIFIPSDCRKLNSRRYENAPIDISNADIIIVDLTYSLLLKNIDLKIFLESDYKKRITEIKERNLARDPDQNFGFIVKVLEIEHEIIQKLKKRANLVISKDYKLTLS